MGVNNLPSNKLRTFHHVTLSERSSTFGIVVVDKNLIYCVYYESHRLLRKQLRGA